MNTIKEGTLQDGTNIYLEDWQSQKYWYKFVVSAYPIAKLCGSGYFSPKNGEHIRIAFNFETEEQAEKVFTEILKGNKSLKDFNEYAENKKYLELI